MKHKILLALGLVVITTLLSACGGAAVQVAVPTTSGGNTSRLVELNYFYEADSCVCLALARTWIDDTIHNDYKAQTDSGKLVYHSWNTQDAANAGIMKQFKAPFESFFVSTFKGGQAATHEVTGLWLYTDSTGKNEMLKTKFITLLKSEIDKALAQS